MSPLPAETVVDRAARDEAVALLWRLFAHELSLGEVQRDFPRSGDQGVRHGYLFLVSFESHELLMELADREANEVALRRWMLFLRSDLPMRWPQIPPPITLWGRRAGLGGCVVVGLLAVAFLGTPVLAIVELGLSKEVVAVGVIALLAVAALFVLRSRSGQATRDEWSSWMRAGDPGFHPFRSADEVQAAGGDPHQLRSGWQCPCCGYELVQGVEPGCPECGLGRDAISATSPPSVPTLR